MPRGTDIDRLIEEGLQRYGSGDLDGALVSWERALSLDPENAQANSYVDYVHTNYDLLVEAKTEATDAPPPLPIQETPEYQIEVTPGALRQSTPSIPRIDTLDGGWFMEEETHENPPAPEPTDPGPPGISLPVSGELEMELQLDEGPAPPQPDSSPGISFDDATREYANREAILAPDPGKEDFAGGEQPTTEFRHEETPTGFAVEGTPVGFGSQLTDVKQRDLGFVRPQEAAPKATKDKPSSPMSIGHAPTMELGAAGRAPAPAKTGHEQTAEIEKPPPRPITRDMPPASRAPARDVTAVSQAEVMLSHAQTRDLEIGKTTQRIGSKSVPPATTPADDLAIGQPTRDLGLRPGGRPATQPPDEDMPTRESDVRAIRQEVAARGRAKASTRPPTESTRHDIALPFDPIEQRAAEILDEVDVEAPAGETPEDRTRRRLGALFERAVAYHGLGDLEKAVVAIDLALSEDPSTALAQKLIHRNRDTIMNVFQGYLGDLERQPQLARPLHELASAGINPRAAFLLSRIDGTLSVDEILDVSGMPRLEAYRYLCQLFLKGILK